VSCILFFCLLSFPSGAKFTLSGVQPAEMYLRKEREYGSSCRVCKIHFAHAVKMFTIVLCQIADERVFVEDIISSRLSPTDLEAMQKRVNDVIVGE
jgi:hypothetical protein